MTALCVAAALAGCGQDRPGTGAEAAQAREAAARSSADVVATAVGDSPLLGTGSTDACFGGQDNLTVRDDFDYYCVLGDAGAIALSSADAPSALLEADQLLLAACPSWPEGALASSPDAGVLATDPAIRTATAHADCNGVDTSARVVRAASIDAVAAEVSTLPLLPDGSAGDDRTLDGRALLARAQQSGSDFVLVVSTTIEYMREP